MNGTPQDLRAVVHEALSNAAEGGHDEIHEMGVTGVCIDLLDKCSDVEYLLEQHDEEQAVEQLRPHVQSWFDENPKKEGT